MMMTRCQLVYVRLIFAQQNRVIGDGVVETFLLLLVMSEVLD